MSTKVVQKKVIVDGGGSDRDWNRSACNYTYAELFINRFTRIQRYVYVILLIGLSLSISEGWYNLKDKTSTLSFSFKEKNGPPTFYDQSIFHYYSIHSQSFGYGHEHIRPNTDHRHFMHGHNMTMNY